MSAPHLVLGALAALSLPCAAHDWERVRDDAPARQWLYVDAGSLSGADGLFLYLSTAARGGQPAQRLVWHRADCARRRLGFDEVRRAGSTPRVAVGAQMRWRAVAQVDGNHRYAWQLLCASAGATVT